MQSKDDNVLKQSSDDERYAQLYQRYAPALFAYVYQQISSREDAEDIVLTVFLCVLQNQRFPAFDERKQEKWLWTLTRNKLVDHFWGTIRHPQVSTEWLSEPLYAGDGYNPEQTSLKHEEYTQLANAVRKLPKLQQDVLRLRFGHGLTSNEIGSVLEKSGGAVRMLLTRTLRHLRSFYKDQVQGSQR